MFGGVTQPTKGNVAIFDETGNVVDAGSGPGGSSDVLINGLIASNDSTITINDGNTVVNTGGPARFSIRTVTSSAAVMDRTGQFSPMRAAGH